MSRYLILKFNLFNKALQESIQKGEYSLYLELLIDSESQIVTFDNFSCTKEIKIPTKKCMIGCILHFSDREKEYRYVPTPHIVSASEENVVFSFNLYGYRYNERDLSCIDFGPGDIPQRLPKKCYVATCVYGSYDCPQVWTLRRYRDNILSQTWHGRAFIRTYYFFSPTLVKWFGKAKWFNKVFKPKLDRLVEKLNKKGIVNTPYDDQN